MHGDVADALAFFVEPGHEVEGVVGEESLHVQSICKELCYCRYAHGAIVVVRVHDIAHLQDLVQSLSIGLHARRCNYHLAGPAKPESSRWWKDLRSHIGHEIQMGIRTRDCSQLQKLGALSC